MSLVVDLSVPLKEARDQLTAAFEKAYLVERLRGVSRAGIRRRGEAVGRSNRAVASFIAFAWRRSRRPSRLFTWA
jgi:hypothetical protein